MIRNLGKLSAFAGLVAVAGALGVNCSKGGSSDNGDVKIAFNIPNGDQINSVHYVINESDKTSPIVQGDMDTHDVNANASLDVALPPTGTGVLDTVVLTATTKNGLMCTTGVTPGFAVVSNVPSTIMLTLACGTGSQPTVPGTVDITANVTVADNCPSITSAVVAPGQTSVGGTVSVSATGFDPDMGDSITFGWGPTASYFANPAAASTTYTCTLPGVQQIVLSITDSKGCIAQVPLMVNCVPVSLCGNGHLDPGEQCDPPNGVTCDTNCQTIVPATGGTAGGGTGGTATGGVAGGTGGTGTGGVGGGTGGTATGGVAGGTGGTATGGVGGTGGTVSGTGGMPLQSAACTSCEQAGVTAMYCTNTSPVNPMVANGAFGCAGFKDLNDQQHCIALVECLRGATCQSAIQGAAASFNESMQFFDSPLPCLCGDAFASSETSPGGAAGACSTNTDNTKFNGVCAAQFIAASVNVIDAVVSPTHNYANQNYPEGVAKQLMQCDVDATCQSVCP
jgi:hypothetical protein